MTEDSDAPIQPTEEAMPDDPPVRGSGVVKVGNTLEIDTGARLPEFEVARVKAYRATSSKTHNVSYIALVCEHHLTPRHHAIETYSSFANPYLAQVATTATIYWPPAKQERFVIIYKDMPHKRLMEKSGEPALALRQDQVLEYIVKPMISILQDFRDKDFVHGSICPMNMYYTMAENKIEGFVLGDCLSVPASYAQPTLFETIERSMVDPIGRGKGIQSDDLYAFGVTLATLLRTTDPLKGMDDDAIIRAKIELGSYAAIAGKERFSGSILELLRGLLLDDPTQRWTMDEVLVWLDGRRLSPKQSTKQKKAARPISFNGQKYFRASFLAMDIDTNPQETQRIVENGELEQWLSRSLEDTEAIERLEVAQKSSREKGVGPGYEERLVANLSTALDPYAPIRYRGLRLNADGVGSALAEAMSLKQDVRPFIDLFTQNIVLTWLGAQLGSNIDLGSLIKRFDNCRNYVRQPKIGYGIERCLYILSPESYCMSEALSGYYARSPEDILRAFEDICQKGKPPKIFIDRHIVAFLLVHDQKTVENVLTDLEAGTEEKRILANLKVLALIQKRSNLPKFPGIGQAIEKSLSVVLNKYHDRKLRKKIEKTLEAAAADGSLSKMLNALENVEVSAKDHDGFTAARREYAELTAEYEELEKNLENKATYGRVRGGEVAALLSCIVSAIMVLFIFFMLQINDSGF